jgi:DNA (cytosine-5)-methyltransferase 1
VRLVGGNAAPHAAKGRELSWDAPLPSVLALNAIHSGHQFMIETGGAMPAVAAPEQVKPAYRVPRMDELAPLGADAPTVVSTFSGCGGSCLGFRLAGYRALWASEFVDAAAATYAANYPETPLDRRDIRTVTADEILSAIGKERGDVDVLEGSPPCQPFSTAGKREKSWGKIREYGDHRQRADDLFFEYVRLVDGLQPRVFVAENVSGLVKGTAKGYFKQILAALKACGYVVQAKLLDAQWLGVPQARQRIIFVGVREDLGMLPAFPKPLPYRYSVRDALPWIGEATGRLGTGYHRSPVDPDGPLPTVTASGAEQTRYEVVEGNGNGHSSARGRRHDLDEPLPTVVARAVRRSGGTDQFWLQTKDGIEQRGIHDTRGLFSSGDVTDRPCPTIVIGAHSADSGHYIVESRPLAGAISGGSERLTYDGVHHLHPLDGPAPTVMSTMPGARLASQDLIERRKFTIGELRRICAFPDDFVLCGTYAEQWARLGNAVPPVMMRHIAETIRDHVLLPGPG